jgi:hypothetical protein
MTIKVTPPDKRTDLMAIFINMNGSFCSATHAAACIGTLAIDSQFVRLFCRPITAVPSVLRYEFDVNRVG